LSEPLEISHFRVTSYDSVYSVSSRILGYNFLKLADSERLSEGMLQRDRIPRYSDVRPKFLLPPPRFELNIHTKVQRKAGSRS